MLSTSEARKTSGESFRNAVSSIGASSIRLTKPVVGRADFRMVMSCPVRLVSAVTQYTCLPIAGTRSALRRPLALSREANMIPRSEKEETAKYGTC